jgi:DNA primase
VITQETGLSIKGKHLEQCPFCGGHNCFSIDAEKGLYKCFQCPAAGDVFTFYQNYLHLSSTDALKRGAERAGTTLKGAKSPNNYGALDLTVRETIFLEAAKYYHDHMLDNGGKEYLIGRRGHKEEVLKNMLVGWSDGGLVNHLLSKGFTNEQLKASGLAKGKDDSGSQILWDFFGKGLAIFPHVDRGRVVHFTQKDPEPDPEKRKKYQLPNDYRSREWKFYHQDALSIYQEVIVVEGENDLLTILDAGIQNVIGLIGQPADYQVKALKAFCVSKQLYLWMDNDEGGKKFIRQLCPELKINTRIIWHPSDDPGHPAYVKDPDEYLRAFPGDRRKEIKRLQEVALPHVAWEIREIARLVTLEERLKALKDRKIFAAVADMVEVEKMVYIEKLVALGFPAEAIEEQLEVNQDLRRELALYFEKVPKKDADPNYIASCIFKHLSQNGRFFKDAMDETFLLYQHRIYLIGNNRPFNALMKKMSGLLPTKEPGRSVWESLASEAFNAGVKIDRASWIHADRKECAVFVNLNLANNVILKISPGRIEEIPNGLNENGVLLNASNKLLPANFNPDADVQEGMRALKELIMDNMTCDREQRYLVLCWFISAFLLDFAPYMALMKFSGAWESGKSTPAKFLSLLIYGDEHLSEITTAGAYRSSANNPLLIFDDLESEDVTKSLSKFLRLAATKGEKEKSSSSSDHNTITEKPKGLILITAIDPLLQTAVISRTIDIEFEKKYLRPDFIEDEIKRELVQKRDLILSAILKLLSREILPALHEGKDQKDYIAILRKEYPKHAKRRMDEYLSILMLILNRVMKYVPYYTEDDFEFGVESGEKDIRKAWIEYQNDRAKDNETSSNSIIKMLDGLVREYSAKMKDCSPAPHMDYRDEQGNLMDGVFSYTHPEYLIEMVKTKSERIEDEHGNAYTKTCIEFMATPSDIVHAFDRWCRNNGQRNPYENVSVFGQRFKNERTLLTKVGWEVAINPKKPHLQPYYEYVNGVRFYKLRKTIVR